MDINESAYVSESAYVAALSTVLNHKDLQDSFVRTDHSAVSPQQLFDPEVQAIYATCQELLRENYPAIYVLSRFLQRKAGWIVSRSFLKYFDSYFFARYRATGKVGLLNETESELPETAELQKMTSTAMRTLQQCGMVDILYEAGNSSRINVKESISALSQTLTNEELKQLLKKFIKRDKNEQ